MNEIKCVICGKTVQTNRKRYCSLVCYRKGQKKIRDENPDRHRKEQIKANNRCPKCGKLISISAKFCWEHMEKKIKKGSSSPCWKGGRSVKHGYIIIFKPEHPRSHGKGWVLEHIVIWEQSHNKPLPEGWIIHHLNGVRGDNRPSNLSAMPDKKHRHILAAKAKRIQELESLLINQGILF